MEKNGVINFMVNVTELLVNLKEFAVQYLVLTTEDKILFKDLLKYVYYMNGVVGLDYENLHIYQTNYTQGNVGVDNDKHIFYINGELIADNDTGVIITGCKLTIP